LGNNNQELEKERAQVEAFFVDMCREVLLPFPYVSGSRSENILSIGAGFELLEKYLFVKLAIA